ncbi:hypothetical protein SS50377_25556 [Spironucleus salmonicida]|uniref:Uncharacterized protein n=1 Tax=Spironucleus salmonicida TaxID=348837 RepID=V6LWB6_9EUKA|nr:hypothetical protein SS50377_25556 [Spironucleus salmonicida]|eukprot:EST45104.1 Hypothetical protein SS50377_15124 [Spironucleus salmonicida]
MTERTLSEYSSDTSTDSSYKVSFEENDSFCDFPLSTSDIDHFILIHRQKRYIDISLLENMNKDDIYRLIKMIKQAQVIDISPEQILGYLSIFDQKVLATVIQSLGILKTTSFKVHSLIKDKIDVDLHSISQFFQYYKQQIKIDYALHSVNQIENWMVPNLFKFNPINDIALKWKNLDFKEFTDIQIKSYIDQLK